MTYEQLLIECAKRGLKLVPDNNTSSKIYEFSVIVRFNRGLGAECINLKNVRASTIHEAQILADEQAQNYFKITPDMKEAIIGEIKIRPLGN